MTAPAAQRRLLPFRNGTRQRRRKIGTIPFVVSSSGTPLELPKVGYLSKLIFQLRGTIDSGAAVTFADLGPWNILSRIRVNTNIGQASLVDVSGFGAHVMQRTIWRGWTPDSAGVGSTTPNADIHAAPVANALGQAVVLTWEVPLSINSGPNFETGLFNLQAPDVRVTIEPVFGALTDYGTNVTAAALTLHCYMEFYEVPDPRVFSMPPLAIVRWLEDQQPVTQTGENIYTVPRGGTLLNLAHVVQLNGARSDSVDSLEIKFNKTDSVYLAERQWHRVIERELYELLPVTGVFYHDWYEAYAEVNRGDVRDAIDSEAITTLDSIVNVTSGAVLGANNNFLKAVRRILQVLA